MAKSAGQEPPKFEDNMPYSNWGIEDLLKLDELASMIRMEIIPP